MLVDIANDVQTGSWRRPAPARAGTRRLGAHRPAAPGPALRVGIERADPSSRERLFAGGPPDRIPD